MKQGVLYIMMMLSTSFAQQSPSWRFENGPWAAQLVCDFAIGYKNGNRVIYAAEQPLVKSTDGGNQYAAW